ncbi:hypothetical protein E2C01_093694 [Portunus trituberculatus]|uniref:Uncharacterized protein n=1 Tax=Portunus trituberculatus TaxID=210409 RepID=A0A5B7JZE9_PORTR|nr:hypothetical protein [Portunus trituberculatus]
MSPSTERVNTRLYNSYKAYSEGVTSTGYLCGRAGRARIPHSRGRRPWATCRLYGRGPAKGKNKKVRKKPT